MTAEVSEVAIMTFELRMIEMLEMPRRLSTATDLSVNNSGKYPDCHV